MSMVTIKVDVFARHLFSPFSLVALEDKNLNPANNQNIQS